MEPIVVGVMELGAAGGTGVNTPKKFGVATRRYDRYLGVGATGSDQNQ